MPNPSTLLRTFTILLPLFTLSSAEPPTPLPADSDLHLHIDLWKGKTCHNHKQDHPDQSWDTRQGYNQILQDKETAKVLNVKSFTINRSLWPNETLTFFTGPDKEKPCAEVVGEIKQHLEAKEGKRDDEDGDLDDKKSTMCLSVHQAPRRHAELVPQTSTV